MLVSVIIPTYNRASIIEYALDSVLSQSYAPIELVVIDDGSTDGTEKLLERYLAEYPDVVKHHRKSNGGCASARNTGVSLCTGDFVAFLDSDDRFLPNAIASMMAALLDTGADFVYSPIVNVYDGVHETTDFPAAAGKPDRFAREHFLTNNAYSCSILYRRAIFDVYRLDEDLRYNEDSDFLQKVAIRFRAAYLPQPVAKVFHHDSNKSQNRVGIHASLLKSSERILADYPDFAASLGGAAQERIRSLKEALVEQLVINKRLDECREVAIQARDIKKTHLYWSLRLNSTLPTNIALAANRFKAKIDGLWIFKNRRDRFANVMHLFGVYLPMTENWCYRLIKYLPDTRLYIVAERSENEAHFVLPNSLVLVMPTAEWPRAPYRPIAAGVKLICLLLRKIWMRLVIHFARKSSLIHAHFSFMGWNYLQLSIACKVPMVVSYYGYDYECLPNRDPVWKERYAEMFQRAAMFITEGNVARGKLVGMGCPPEKVRVVHLGVETALIPFFRRTKRAGELKLIQVATFTEKKGHDTTVNAFMLAAKSCPEMTLTLVGNDKEGIRARLQKAIRDAGMNERVEFIDAIDFKKLHLFLKPYHLFVHPSEYARNGDSEGGAPVVLLDAQATGMPVLATNHCDIPEEVIHGETGMLVAEGDFQALAREMERFYWMAEAEYAAFCERARRHVEAQYEAADSGRVLQEVYAEVVRSCGKQ